LAKNPAVIPPDANALNRALLKSARDPFAEEISARNRFPLLVQLQRPLPTSPSSPSIAAMMLMPPCHRVSLEVKGRGSFSCSVYANHTLLPHGNETIRAMQAANKPIELATWRAYK
jgi:hypothetical protein